MSPVAGTEWWWDLVVLPVQRVWVVVRNRLSVRKNGLRRLKREVTTCEYEDVRVMWELLNKAGSGGKQRRRRRRRLEGNERTAWAPYNLCQSF